MKFRKFISVILVAVMAMGVFTAGASASTLTEKKVDFVPRDVQGEKNYTIENPYKDVQWGKWHAYKASLHSHTNASDAVPTIAESVEKHYELGYDILAISDHAVIGVPWNEIPTTVPIYRLFKFGNTKMGNVDILTDERRAEILAGVGRTNADGTPQPMLEVIGSAELNGATPINDCHVNGFFMRPGEEYGQARMGVYGDYETVVEKVGEAGGITFLDHVGEYVGSEYDITRASEPYYANKFANVFLDNPSCVGMDVNSGVNNHTIYDYILWDNILKLTIPHGRNVFAFTFSDGHKIDQYNRNYTYMLMPELTNEALRTSMETGAFFACSHYARADLGEEFNGEEFETPFVSVLDVNQKSDTISFNADNFNYVRWYSDGEIIAEGENLTYLDLNAYEDKLGCYVRFTLTGPGGILYSQAFPITAEGEEIEKPLIVPTNDVPEFLRFLADTANVLLGWTPIMALIRYFLWGTYWWF
ncbi:MAG: hypothetical protein E7536_03955 [Ruminococcaceae bacterium]|nr:hypothetical protein [Oscillospiraceae bacterium]